MSRRIAVIMAGGAGQRFWPLSRRAHPKQFLSLTGQGPMLKLAVDRAAALLGLSNVYILTNQRLVAQVQELIPDAPAENIIGEPVGRNTAACLALALAHTGYDEAAPTMAVLTADHHLEKLDRFEADVTAALDEAEKGEDLVIMGVPPTEPHTGFGYLEVGRTLSEVNRSQVCEVKAFHEKPEPSTARQYVAAGNFLWNSGMFFWKNATLFAAFAKHMPLLAEQVREMRRAINPPGSQTPSAEERARIIRDAFEGLESISIDYGVLERAENVKCVRATFAWDDIGSWDAVARKGQTDEEGNFLSGDVLALETKNCILFGSEEGKGPLIAALGVEDLVIAALPDAVLVCRRQDAQRVKELVKALQDKKRENLT